MTIQITLLETNYKIAEAALVFDAPEDGLLYGLRMVGFTIHRTPNDHLGVGYPEKHYKAKGDYRYYKLLRPAAHHATSALPQHPLTTAILAAYEAHMLALAPAPAPQPEQEATS